MGRRGNRPGNKTGRKLKISDLMHLVRRFMKKMSADKVGVYSAQASFYLMMGFPPMLLLMFTFLRYTPLTETMVLDMLSRLLNEDMMEMVTSVVSNIYQGSLASFSFALISVLWMAGGGMMGLTNGLNSIHSVYENRNYFVLRFRSSLYAIILVIAFVVAFGAMVVGMRFQNQLSGILPFFSIGKISNFVLIFLAMLMLAGLFTFLYVSLPNKRMNVGIQVYGALFTTMCWSVFSFFFSIYLSAAQYLSLFYGGLITLMMALLWLYFSIYLFFFGAEVSAFLENPDEFPF